MSVIVRHDTPYPNFKVTAQKISLTTSTSGRQELSDLNNQKKKKKMKSGLDVWLSKKRCYKHF